LFRLIYEEENGIIIKGLPNILDDRYIKEVNILKTLMENFDGRAFEDEL